MSRLVPVSEFDFPGEDKLGNEHFKLTCVNHQTAEYLTKNPFLRHVHIIKFPKGLAPEERSPSGECKCPFSDLVVVVEEEDSEEGTNDA